MTQRPRSWATSITTSPILRRWPGQVRSSRPSTPADHNVRAQTAAVEAHVGDGPVGCNQEREHVKPLDAVILEQIRTRFGFSFCCCQRFPEKPKGLVKGRRIPGNDVWIAAVALEHGLQLLTLDVYLR